LLLPSSLVRQLVAALTTPPLIISRLFVRCRSPPPPLALAVLALFVAALIPCSPVGCRVDASTSHHLPPLCPLSSSAATALLPPPLHRQAATAALLPPPRSAATALPPPSRRRQAVPAFTLCAATALPPPPPSCRCRAVAAAALPLLPRRRQAATAITLSAATVLPPPPPRFSVGMDEVLNLWLLWWWWCGNDVYVRSVRKILFSDTHSDVCSYEHLPRNNFRRMNVLVPTSYTYFILRLKCANFNAKSYLQKKYPNH
jgi:hypothetical protein